MPPPLSLAAPRAPAPRPETAALICTPPVQLCERPASTHAAASAPCSTPAGKPPRQLSEVPHPHPRVPGSPLPQGPRRSAAASLSLGLSTALAQAPVRRAALAAAELAAATAAAADAGGDGPSGVHPALVRGLPAPVAPALRLGECTSARAPPPSALASPRPLLLSSPCIPRDHPPAPRSPPLRHRRRSTRRRSPVGRR